MKRVILKIAHALAYLYYVFLFLFFFPISNLIFYRKKIWLISERGYDARDNGLHFFKYVSDNHPEINCYYVIDKKSSDYKNVKSYKNVLQFGSLKHIFLFTCARAKISSQVFGYAPNKYYVKFMQKHHLQGKNIGLKHGIFKNIHPNYFKKNAHLDLIICGAKPEFEFIRDNFGYKESEVAYCGLARFDNLGTTDTFHQILIMPTFRITLSGLSLDEFIKTEYYNKWLGFLQELDIKFGNLNGFKVIFYLHAVFQKYISAFKGKLKNIEIANFDDYDVQVLLNESKVLITDYSSVFFDFAYLRKPMIFYQFDEEFYTSNHYQKGYFDYRLNGFGRVFANQSECFVELLSILEKDCKLDSIFIDRTNQFFTLPNDRKNCSRIFEEVLKIV